MKILDKISLTLFSLLILIISIVCCLLVVGWLNLEYIGTIFTAILNNQIYSNITLGVCIVLSLLAIKCIFFGGTNKEKEEYKNGILLQNSEGKLLITRETIENLVNGIAKGFDSAEQVETRIDIDSENNLIVFVNLIVSENAIIKELSTNLQTKIKETVKNATDLIVKEVNIKVKNIQEVQKEIVQ